MNPGDEYPAHTFLLEWVEWVDRGAPEGAPFSRKHGLRANERLFSRGPSAARGCVERMLIDEFGRNPYPFGGLGRYDDDMKLGAMHLNAARVKWARANALQKWMGLGL